ncbi:MAG: helix-turn-helix domain-containing protein [Deltaproteobacteria bacterium]|nr:helix-turn-helix domain-containing protein [Deltaproteobacteria bacterium]MBW2417987.1 helix-turn-helix domain-containing protein [Deltaproteobacteria bacterium]
MQNHLIHIAERIKEWREQAGMTLKELGERAGVSASTIHKVENRQVSPTIAVLLKISHGLGRHPAELLTRRGEPVRYRIRGHDEGTRLGDAEHTHVTRLGSDLHDARLEMWRAVVQPGALCWDGMLEEEGEIITFCESGEIHLQINGEAYRLGPGDSFHCKTSVPRRWSNRGSKPAVVTLAFTLPRERGENLPRRLVEVWEKAIADQTPVEQVDKVARA